MSTRRPRYRYIAFRVESARAVSRAEVLEALHGLPERPWLVDFGASSGLVRATNRTKDAVIASIRGLRRIGDEAVQITTLGTSGTIRKARAKYLD